MEVTLGIFKATENIYKNNKGSILRTAVYTVGHFIIAITVLRPYIYRFYKSLF